MNVFNRVVDWVAEKFSFKTLLAINCVLYFWAGWMAAGIYGKLT